MASGEPIKVSCITDVPPGSVWSHGKNSKTFYTKCDPRDPDAISYGKNAGLHPSVLSRTEDGLFTHTLRGSGDIYIHPAPEVRANMLKIGTVARVADMPIGTKWCHPGEPNKKYIKIALDDERAKTLPKNMGEEEIYSYSVREADGHAVYTDNRKSTATVVMLPWLKEQDPTEVGGFIAAYAKMAKNKNGA
jgi:hypothetical protein